MSLYMQQLRYVGLSGFATVGKDLFFTLLNQEYPSVRFSLADILKLEIREKLIEDTGIDILRCSPEDKESIRSILVSYGKEKRKSSEGRHWINLLDNMLKNCSTYSKIPVITDIRYAEYENDEVSWLKNELGGVLVYIKKYEYINGVKEYAGPPNEDEAINDPLIQEQADYVVDWEVVKGDPEEKYKSLNSHVKKFIDWYGKVL